MKQVRETRRPVVARLMALMLCLAIPAALSARIAWSVWPGLMSYDSLLALTEARQGISTAVWPPMHAYLLRFSAQFPFAPGSLIFLQGFLLGGAGVALAFRLFSSTSRAVIASLVYLSALAASPSVAGALAVHWRDPLTAAAFVLAVAAWVSAPGRPTWTGLILGALAATVCLALRYNAFPIIAPLTALMIYRVWRFGPVGTGRWLAIILLVVPYPLAIASVTWRLPDFQRMPAASNLATTRLFDLVGIGACSGVSYLPTAAGSSVMTPPEDLRRAYTPLHANRVVATLEARGFHPKPMDEKVMRDNWLRAVSGDPMCFLSHRRLVLLAQLGLLKGDPFYPVHDQIDPNELGFSLQRPEAAARYVAGVAGSAHAYWNRPAVLLAAAALLMILSFWGAPERRLIKLALATGAIGYTGVLFLVSPAADARYIVPALAAAALLAGISAADLSPGGPTRSTRR